MVIYTGLKACKEGYQGVIGLKKGKFSKMFMERYIHITFKN